MATVFCGICNLPLEDPKNVPNWNQGISPSVIRKINQNRDWMNETIIISSVNKGKPVHFEGAFMEFYEFRDGDWELYKPIKLPIPHKNKKRYVHKACWYLTGKPGLKYKSSFADFLSIYQIDNQFDYGHFFREYPSWTWIFTKPTRTNKFGKEILKGFESNIPGKQSKSKRAPKQKSLESTCKCLTKTGKRCRNAPKSNGFCHLHQRC